MEQKISVALLGVYNHEQSSVGKNVLTVSISCSYQWYVECLLQMLSSRCDVCRVTQLTLCFSLRMVNVRSATTRDGQQMRTLCPWYVLHLLYGTSIPELFVLVAHHNLGFVHCFTSTLACQTYASAMILNALPSLTILHSLIGTECPLQHMQQLPGSMPLHECTAE